MAEEVARRKADFKGLMERIEAIEYQHTDAVGLTAVLESGRKLGAKRDEIVSTLEKTRREQQAVDTELQELDQSQGRFHTEAIKKFEKFLSQLIAAVNLLMLSLPLIAFSYALGGITPERLAVTLLEWPLSRHSAR